MRRTRERRKSVEEQQNNPERQTEEIAPSNVLVPESPRAARRKRRENADPVPPPSPAKSIRSVQSKPAKPSVKTRFYTPRDPIKLREPPPPIVRILDLVDPEPIDKLIPAKKPAPAKKNIEPRQRPRRQRASDEALPVLESFESAIIVPSIVSTSDFFTGSNKPRKLVSRKKDVPSEPAMPILAAEKHDLAPLKEKIGRDLLKTLKRVEEREKEDRRLKEQQTALEQKYILPRPLSPASQSLQDAMLLLPDEIVREQNKKTKLTPEERILLSQFYHDNFLVYHVPRYNNPDYTYVFPNSSIKDVLLSRWAEELTKVGGVKRTASELKERIEEMVKEVQDFRKATERGWHSQIPGIQSSPSFLLVNKVHDYIPESSAREINKVLDQYELKLMIDREDEIVKTVVPGLPWKIEENHELGNLYMEFSNYNINVLRKDGIESRQEILKIWADRLEQLCGTKRSIIDIERKVSALRKEYLSHFFSPNRDQPVQLSVPAITLTENLIDCLADVDPNMSLERAMDCIRRVQENVLKKNPPKKQENPQVYDMATNSCRTNRPHMSRRERHLLAMLYRQNYQEYEQFNKPQNGRKEFRKNNKKKELLAQWSLILSELGVSQREPDELASKISQYKNIVKNHKLCQKEGINALFMKSEYKLRKVQRPLSPTTKLFDLEDTDHDSETTSDKIKAYMEECQIVINYPYAPTPSPEKKKTPVKGPSKSPPKKNEKEAHESVPDASGTDAVPSGLYRFGSKPGSSFNPEPSPPDSNRTSSDDPIIDVVSMESPAPSVLAVRRAKNQNTNVENVLWDTYFAPAETEDTSVLITRLMAECQAMEEFKIPFLTYDVIDVTGAVTKMAVSRDESQRDINFFLWTKYMSVETDQPINFYVCFTCELMSMGPGGERHRSRSTTSVVSNSGILAQQSLPTMAVDSKSKRIDISWAKTVPKHRCVPFLQSTICEKLAIMSHMLKRTTRLPDDPAEEDVRHCEEKPNFR